MTRARIGTRGSPLALWQAHHIRDRLTDLHEGIEVEIRIIKTRGDQAVAAERYGMLDKGMFTTEIEDELRGGSIDLAVHSLKDLPTDLAEGLSLAAITLREDPADAVIGKDGLTLDTLPQGATVLSGSLRRRGQLLHRRADLCVRAVRGNVQTRLRKLDEGDAHAMILARAGLVRSGLDHRITERLDPIEFLPACGQGALAVETRADDTDVATLLAPLNDAKTRIAVCTERAVLTALGGGCQIPVGAYARFETDNGMLTLTGMVCDLYGRTLLRETIAAPVADTATGEALGHQLGDIFRENGSDEILTEVARQIKTETENAP